MNRGKLSPLRLTVGVALVTILLLSLPLPVQSQEETVIDDSSGNFSVLGGNWTLVSNAEAREGSYRYNEAGSGDDSVQWNIQVSTSREYTVFVYWPSVENAATDASFTVVYHGGEQTLKKDQRVGNRWVELGTYYFTADENGKVILNDNASSGLVIADAVNVSISGGATGGGEGGLTQKFVVTIVPALLLFGLLFTFHIFKPLRKILTNPVLFVATVLVVLLIMTRGLFSVPSLSGFIGNEKSLWGTFFTLSVFVIGFGLYVMFKYKSWYIRIRTISLIFFAEFLLAFIVNGLAPGNYNDAVKIIYPFPFSITSILEASSTLLPVIAITSFLIFPVLALLLGRRFYCSWVCGHGVYSETFGDSFRTKTPNGKTVNRKVLYSIENLRILVLIFTVAAVALVLNGVTTVGAYGTAASQQSLIALGIGALLILPTPFFGGRLYCRFVCPMGAYLGLISRVGQYGIVTNKSKCTGCGICSRNCHMGIDVKSFAQEGKILRSSQCVGCGICVATCPVKALRFRGIRESTSALLRSFRK